MIAPPVMVRRHRDLGLTLIELLISITLTMIIGGVISAALITSMNAASSTAAQASDSTDAQLIAAYLTRDAQAAGGTDPATAQLVADLGVSTASTATGWAGCSQTGSMVVRFSWIDRGSSLGTTPVVVTYALASDGSFVRRACEGSTQTDVVLGRRIVSASATCAPGGVCSGLPDQVTLTVRGGAAASPFDYTLTASLRGEAQTSPTSVNSSQAPLVVLRTTSCPVLSVTGTGTTYVRGDAVVAAGCGASPTSGDLTKLSVSGSTTLPTSVSDAFAALTPPSATCGSGTNPTLGSSSGAGVVNVYPQAVTVTGTVVFKPGRYVFCNGITVAAGASVTGTDVLWYVADGAVTVASTATVDLAPATTGTYANLVLWAAGTQAVTITNGATVDELRGMVYVPRGAVTVSSTAGTRLGGLFASTVTLSGTGPTRLGLPSPTLAVAATLLPDGGTGSAYSATAPAISGGTSPYTYTASGLPAGLTMSSTGAITGTPTANGTSTVSFVGVDATGASVAFSRSLAITGAPSGCPSTTSGWWGQYWSNNSLTGAATLCRADASLSFDWGAGSPDASIPADNFSVRWTRVQDFAAGDYVFTAGSDDGVRLYVDGTLILDRWATRSMTYDDVTRTLTAGTHTIVMEYYEGGGVASAYLSYGIGSSVGCPTTITGWRGEYWSNKNLTGSPVGCQDDAAIDFDWAGGKPAVLPNPDNFGVRWTRTQQFLAGTYTFQAGGDDGVRLYIDGIRVLDSWVDTAYVVRTYTGAVTAGPHTIVMEFYENGGFARATLAWSVTSVPGVPANLAVTPGDTVATVSWAQGVTSGEAATTGYTVTATAAGQTTRTCTTTPPTTTCTLTGLANAVTYSVAVTATNSVGTSAAATTTTMPRPAVLSSTGLQLWLDAADPDGDGAAEGAAENCDTGVSCAASSNVLTRWEDKSGKDHDAVQAVPAKAGSFVSATPAVNFDANGGYTATVDLGPDETAFVVAQSDTATWNTWGWLISSRRPNGFIVHPEPGSASVGWYATNSTGGYTYMGSANVTSLMNPHIYELTQAGSNPIISSASLDARIVTSDLAITGQVRTASAVPIVLGADDYSGRNGDGKYREVIIFGRALSVAERRAVQEYLARRWSIAITPAAPAAPTVLAGNGNVLVSFTAPTWDGGSAVMGYTATASPGGATCTATLPATSCTVTGLTNGTAYTFTAVASNAIGTGASSASSAVAMPGPPPAPTAVSGTVADSSSVVTWTAPVLTGRAAVSSYTVTATASGQTTQTCTATAPATTCTVTGLANYVTYTLSVTATNSSGAGPATTATVTPDWTPATLGGALTWWFDANDASALTGSWVTQTGYTVTGTAGGTRLTASSGVVERIDVLAGGTGYTSAPTVTVAGGGGTGASTLYTTVAAGAVTSTSVVARGNGFTAEPTVTVSGPGTGARLRAFITAVTPVGATIRVGGQTYTVIDRDGLTLTVSPALAANVTAGAVEQWRVSNWSNRATPGTTDAKQTATTDQPSLGTMAGRPAVVFDGVNSWMWLLADNGATSFDHGPTWTVLVAYQSERQVAWGAVPQTGTGANTRILATSGGGQADWASTENLQVNPNQSQDALNGGPVRIATVSGNGADTFNWTRAFIGGTASPYYSAGWGATARIGEIIFVNAGLGSADVAKAQAYLTRKWSQAAVVPSAPISVAATAGDGQAVVTWRGANTYLSSITAYTVTATSPGRTTQTCTSVVTLSCTLTGLVNGATYTVSVTATNATGIGPASVPVTVVPVPALLSSSSKLWLDGADTSTLNTNAGCTSSVGTAAASVLCWRDKSVNARTVTSSSATAPQYRPAVINGRSAVRFQNVAGVDALMNGPDVFGGSTSNMQWFLVTRENTRSSNALVSFNGSDFSSTGRVAIHAVWAGDNGWYWDAGTCCGTDRAVGPANATAVGATTIMNSWKDSTVARGGFRLNGGASVLAPGNSVATTTGGLLLGWGTTDHDIAEFVAFDRRLTPAEERAVEAYLANKWAITIAPEAPIGVTASQSSGVVTVSWTAPASDGGSAITGYTATASPGGATCTTTTATTCTISGLTSGTTYTFSVTATNAIGTGPSGNSSPLVWNPVGAAATLSVSSPFLGTTDGTNVWTVNYTNGSVSKINIATNAITQVTVGSFPTAMTWDGTSVWVVNSGSNTVSKINPTTNAVVATVAVAAQPYGIAWDGTSIWVTSQSGTVSKINPTTSAVVATVAVGGPRLVSYGAGSIWVSTSAGTLVRINPSTNAVVATITVGGQPYVTVYDGTSIWTATYTGNTLVKVDPGTNTVTSTISMAGSPFGLAYDSGRLWVSQFTGNVVVNVNPTTGAIGGSVAVASGPYGLVYTGNLWVLSYNASTVSKLVP